MLPAKPVPREEGAAAIAPPTLIHGTHLSTDKFPCQAFVFSYVG